jgi:hypothetical protein
MESRVLFKISGLTPLPTNIEGLIIEREGGEMDQRIK